MKNENTKQLRNRYRGALLGLAAGDALGTTLEFKPPGSFEHLTDMIGGGPFNLQPGQWTDDTSMALCLAESLVRCHGFDPKDQMERYCRWLARRLPELGSRVRTRDSRQFFVYRSADFRFSVFL